MRYRAGDQTREFVTKVIAPNGLFYLSDAEFAAARQRLTRAEMAEQFHRNEAMLAAPGPAAGALAKALLRDPLRLHEFIDNASPIRCLSNPTTEAMHSFPPMAAAY